MLYQVYQAHCDLMEPVRVLAGMVAGSGGPGLGRLADHALVRNLTAAYEIIARAGLTHERPPFDIHSVTVGNREVKVTEEPVLVTPFGTLLRFKKDVQATQPRVVLVAPLSGHFATLLRATVATMLPEHDVYVTDWINARNVPVQHGTFGLDDEIALLIDLLHRLGPGAHVMAVCQPSVPVLAAVALMAAAGDPCQPRSMVLMGGPIDPAANPTEVNRFAEAHSLDWFEHMVITTVPARYPGAFR